MEPLFEFVIQVVLEVAVEVLFSSGTRREGGGEAKSTSSPVVALFLVFAGGVLGWTSSMIFPTLFLTSALARWANAALTPIAVGVLMATIGRRRAQKGLPVGRLERFSYAYLFALAMTVARLAACS